MSGISASPRVRGTVNDYAIARCCAIKRDGTRCTGGWHSACHTLYAWDPVTGEGTDGPAVVFCYRHRHLAYRERKGQRIRVVGGWLGSSNEHGYGYALWARETGWKPPAWIRPFLRPSRTGKTRKDAVL